MRLELSYRTQYAFRPRAVNAITALRLRPHSRPGLDVHQASLSVRPGAVSMSYVDAFGTAVDIVEVGEHDVITYSVHALVDTHAVEAATTASPWEQYVCRQDSPRVRRRAVVEIGWTGDASSGWSSVESALAFVHERYIYNVGDTDAETPLEEFLRIGRGVCQDFAHATLALLRGAGWAARYVSGYVFSAEEAGAGRIEADAMHAWVEVLNADRGWVGIDPTTGRLTDDRYVAVGSGRDYDDVRPVRGVVAGSSMQTHEARLHVERVSAQ